MYKLIALLLLLGAVSSQQADYDENLAAKMVNISAATYYTTTEGNTKSCPRCYPGFQVESII